MLFCLSLLVGATLYVVAQWSLGVIACSALLYSIGIVAFFRKPPAIILAIALGLTMFLGALRLWVSPVHEVALGNRAFTAHVLSVSSGGGNATVTARDESGAKYRFVTEAQVLPGDVVSIRGKVEAPKDFVNNTTGRIVSYESYMKARGIDATISFPQVEILEKGHGSISRILTIVQQHLTHVYATYLAYPFDAVVSGMVLGVQGGISDALKQLFLNTGTLHVLVLSGYNITLIAGVIGVLFRKARPQIKTIVIFLGIIFLVGVSGAGVASLRAGLMGSITLVALLARREYNPFRALLIAFLIFFSFSPLSVLYDPGFQLSFLATLAIVTLYPKIEAKFVSQKEGVLRAMQSIVVLSIFMPLFMLPYSMYFSGIIGLSSPIANIFAALFVPVITIVGMILLLLSWISPIASLLGFVLNVIVSIFLWILNVCVHIPVWNAPPLPGLLTTGIYLILFVIVFRNEATTFLQGLRNALVRQTNQLPRENQ